MGFNGAKYFSFLRSVVGIFMFGIQTYFLSKALSYLIRILFFTIDNNILNQDIFMLFLMGMNIIDWSSLILCMVLQIYIFSQGMVSNRKIINLSAIAVYFGMISFFILVLLTDVKLTTKAFKEILNFDNFLDYNNLTPLVSIAGTIFAYFSIIIISFGDFSRYVKDERQLKIGNLTILLNMIFFSFFAVFIVAGADIFLNQNFEDINRVFTNPTDIIGKFDNLQITVITLLFIIIASASTNLVANFIPSQYSLINYLPDKLNLKKVSYTIGFFGLIIGVLWPTLLSQIGILSFIDTFGSFFGPITGVMIINYYLINNSKIEIKDIHKFSIESSLNYSKGWHIKAVYSVTIGFIFSSSTIWNYNLMFLQSYAWIIGALVAGFVYYLLDKR